MRCSKKGPYLGTFLTFGVSLFFRVPIFRIVAKFTQIMLIQSAMQNLHVYIHTAIRKLVLLTIDMFVMSKFMYNYCKYRFCVSLLVISN